MERICLVIGGKIYDSMEKYKDTLIYEMVTFKEAIDIANELEKKKSVDIIISPAGTAAEIMNHVSIPIVKTDISDFDVLETLIKAEEDSKIKGGKIALVMFETKKINIERFQPFLKNKLIYRTYGNEEELKRVVRQFVLDGMDIIVGGPTVVNLCKNSGANGYILRLTQESLQLSINKAKESLSVGYRYKEQSQVFETALSLFTSGVLILNKEGIITEYNQKANDIITGGERQIKGMSFEKLTGDETIKDVYQRGKKQLEKLVKHDDKNFFTNRIPIILEGEIKGAIITLQETASILKLEHKYRKAQAKGFVAKYNFEDIMGKSDSIIETIKIAESFSEVDADVLINGETGTGKELIAQSIHNKSSRRNAPFVGLNCAAFPENLLESELMGYEEGAFTGAKKGGKEGLFEIAHTGTIFLDEINQLPIQLQGRILRVLQEREVLRIGGDRVIPIDVRVIAATNEGIINLIEEGKFRKDLYYRLSVLNLNIPPLRKRCGDIPLLINYYFDVFSKQYGSAVPFDEKSLEFMEQYYWQGNVRELVNFVERYVVINRQLKLTPEEYIREYMEVEKRILNAGKNRTANTISVEMDTLENMESQLIEGVLERFGHNKTQAALAMGISRTTMWKKAKR